MIIRNNYALKPKIKNYTVPIGKGPNDWGIDIDPDYWKHFKDGKCVLSLWFSANKPFNKKIQLGVYMREHPWYHIGWIVYPANTTKPMKFELKWNTNEASDDYSAYQFFIRFYKEEHGGMTFNMREAKIEIGDKSTLYILNKNDVKADNQGIFLAGGYSKSCIHSRYTGGALC